MPTHPSPLPGLSPKRFGVLALVLAAILLASARPARADTFTVTTLADSGPGSLRDAVASANAHAGDDIIVFSAALQQSGGVIQLLGADDNYIWITDTAGSLTIQGNAARSLQVQVTGPTIGFAVASGANLIVNDLVITGARDRAITNSSKLTVNRCTLQSCSYGLINYSTATVNDSLISQNSYGVRSISGTNLNRCEVSGNSTGIWIDPNHSVQAIDCLIRWNSVGVYTGQDTWFSSLRCSIINNVSWAVFAVGGVELDYTTVSGNGSGGVTYYRDLNCNNTTIANNNGWAIDGKYYTDYSTANAYLRNCTVSGNVHGVNLDAHPHLFNYLVVYNCVVGGNTSTDLQYGTTVQLSISRNLFVNGTSTVDAYGNIFVSTAAQLGLSPAGLADNGGTTQTIALVAGSPAIDKGDASLAPSGGTDQRGWGRNGVVDMGAYEYAGAPIPPVITTATAIAGSTAATLGANLTSANVTPGFKCGVLVARTADNSNPVLGGPGVTEFDSTAATSGVFTVIATGLSPTTDYSFVAFAVNSAGISYTAVSTFRTTTVPSFVVNTTADVTNPNDGLTSLREAVASAILEPGTQTITFDPAVFNTAQTITLTSGPINLSDSGAVIQGLGSNLLTISGGGVSRVFNMGSGAATISGVRINNGKVTGDRGGGVMVTGGSLQIADCEISGNTADNGGGVSVTGGAATLTRCQVTGNSTATIDFNRGGGIENQGGTVLLDSCTVSGNYAYYGGGGVFAGDWYTNQGSTTLTACTISGNWGYYGGGFQFALAPTTLTNCTLTGNGGGDGGGGHNWSSTSVQLIHCTVSANTGGGFVVGPGITLVNTVVAAQTTGTDFDASFTDGGHNFVGGDPKLGPLQDNGGPTQTMALLPGSPAIDGAVALASVTTDQRGIARPQGSAPDIGAYEVDPNVPTVTNPSFDAVTNSSAHLYGTVADDHGFPVTRRGIVYSLTSVNPHPSLGGTGVIAVNDPQAFLGTFNETVIGLSASTNYSFAAFAVNSHGTGYSPTATFQTSAPPGDGSLVVTTTVDEDDGTSKPSVGTGTSLREAVAYANALGGDQTITFSPALFANGPATITVSGTLNSILLANLSGTTTISGPGANLLTVQGNSNVRLFQMNQGAARLNGMTLAAGSNGGDGGAILSSGTLSVNDCVFTNNTCSSRGGAIYNGNLGYFSRCTFVNNSAPSFNGGAIANEGTAWVMNCTFSGNSANQGGAIANVFSSSLLHVICSTMTNNSAASAGGALLVNNASRTYVYDAIVSGNHAPSGANVSATPTAGLVSSLIDADPAAIFTTGLLANNGGTTPTIALKPGGPAVNAGTNSVAIDNNSAPLATDQRGKPRVANGTVDIGAYESPVLPTLAASTVTSVTANSAFLGGSVTSDGGGNISKRGVVYALASQNGNPSIGGMGVIEADAAGATGDFSVSVGGLQALSTYAFRSFVTNEVGTVYAAVQTFGTTEAPGLLVTILSDTANHFDGQTSLREAISYAQSLGGAQTITFAPALAGQTITLGTAVGGSDGWDASSVLSITGDITIVGPTTSPGVTLAIDARAALRHFVVHSGASLTLSNLTLTGGQPQLANFNRGGAISAFGNLTARNCTFSGNTSPAEGGAIQSWAGATSLVLENCTFSGNSTGNQGGAISANGTQTTFHYLTITNNTAPNSAVVLWGTQGTMVNSIVAGNSNDTVLSGSGGAFTAQSTNNLLSASSATGLTNGGNGNHLGVPIASLLLGALGNNGGPTPTIAVAPSSPAVDTAIAIAGLTTDQRGTARPQGSAPDIGAFEYSPTPAAAPQIAPGSGTYGRSVLVSLSTASPGATIRYTLNGSDPSETSGTIYTGPFSLAQSATVRAIAVGGGWLPSTVSAADFVVTAASSYVVNVTTDPVSYTDGQLSLRQALAAAAANPGDDTITFDPAVFATTQTIVLTAPLDLSNSGPGNAVTIAGPGAGLLILSGSGFSRIIDFISGAATISGLTISNGHAAGDHGGGVRVTGGTMQIYDCQISGNTADNGGGVSVMGGAATLTLCQVTGNTAVNTTGFNWGGGIENQGGTLVLDRCTVSGNNAPYSGGGIFAGEFTGNSAINTSLTACTIDHNSAQYGGGISAWRHLVSLTNCTLAANGASDGGAGYNFAGTIQLTCCTASANSAGATGGFVIGGGVTLVNSIVAGQTSGADFNSGYYDGGHNFVGGDPKLGPLQDNGGPTQTMALLPGSPAIDSGVPIANCLTDQRGILRGGSGLRGRYYSVPGGTSTALLAPLSNLEALTPASTVLTPRVDFGTGTETTPGDGSVLDRSGTDGNPFGGLGINVGNDQCAALWDGYITVPQTATYRFTTRSDDGSVLYIDGQLVVNNNYFQAATNRSGAIALTAGRHTIEIGFIEGGGGAAMQASWEQLDGVAPFSRQIIPPGVLSTDNTLAGSAPDIGAYELASPAGPQISPAGGSFGRSVLVSLSSPYLGATIRYTLDGSTPSATSGTVYTGPFSLAQSATVRAIAVGGGWPPSPVSSANFVVTAASSYVVNVAIDTLGHTDGKLSLREALAYAAANPGDDIITLDPTVFATPQTIVLTAPLDLSNSGPGNALTLQGPGADKLIFSGGGTSRVIDFSSGVATISGVQISNGQAGGDRGGGVRVTGGSLQITDCVISGNAAAEGAGVSVVGGAATLTRCQVTGNSTAYTDGYNRGGGIENLDGTLLLDRCTVSGNYAPYGGGGVFAGDLFDYGPATTTLIACTISDNWATFGGALFASLSPTSLTNCTLAENAASQAGAGYNYGASIDLTHCTVSANSAGGFVIGAGITLVNSIVAGQTSGADFDGDNYTDGGHNYIGGDPKLGPLQDNGGPTQTMALLPGSPAIDSGVALPNVLTDQRGEIRGGIGLRGRYYAVSDPVTVSLLAPLSNLEALTPATTLLASRVDFGAGTESSPGDGSVLDRAASSGDLFGGLGVDVGITQCAALWDGFITVPHTATYRFTTRSDDGSVLYIDGQLVVNNNYFQSAANRSGTISLAAGRHTIEIGYYQGGGGAVMQASWEQLDGTAPFVRQIIPPGVLSYGGGEAGTAPDIGAYEFEVAPAAAPQITPASGTYESGMIVTIGSSAPGATIYYTLDGSAPSATHGLVYAGPFTLVDSATVLAIATGGGWLPSPVAAASFSVLAPLAYWRNLQGLASDGSQDLATPAGDGVANLLKYAFNMAPNAGDFALANVQVMAADGVAGLPAYHIDAQGRLVIEFVRRKASTSPGIAYVVETGSAPNTLMELSLAGASVVSIDSAWERVTVTDPTVSSRRFGHVRILPLGVYFNNFNAALGAATLRGSAIYTNQAVQLTDAAAGQGGAVTFDGINLVPEVSGFTSKFNLQLGPTTTGIPADGASFAVGDLGTAAWGESGPGTAHHIAVGFDTYDNGTAQGAVGIHLWVNGVDIADNATNPFTNGQPVPVVLSYDAATGLTLTFNGAVIFSNVPVSGFTFRATDKFGFGARTGGANERAIIDDVQIAPR